MIGFQQYFCLLIPLTVEKWLLVFILCLGINY